MPHVVHAGTRIHYSVMGEGPALVLHHGSGSNAAVWIQHGYVKALRSRYRLVLLDARGHGQSDKPHGRALHTLELRVGDVTAVLDALGIESAHFFGYSMGGWIGFGMAKHVPSRIRSLILGGAHPFADPSVSGVELSDADDSHAFLRAMAVVLGEPLTPENERFLLRNDARAVIASLQERVDLGDVLLRIRVPSLLFAGSADRRHALVERAAGELSDARFVSLPDLGHAAAIAASALVLPHVTRFLSAVDAASA